MQGHGHPRCLRLQHRQRQCADSRAEPSVDLLKRDDIGVDFFEHRQYAFGVAPLVKADGLANIIGRNLDRVTHIGVMRFIRSYRNLDRNIHPSPRRAAYRKRADQSCGLPHARRNALAAFAAHADAIIQCHVVAKANNLVQRGWAIADQRRAFDGIAKLAVLDQIGLGTAEHEFARHDVDLPATEAFGEDALWAFKPTREGNTVVMAQRQASRPKRADLMAQAEAIENRFDLPATKWLRVFKPLVK